MKYIAKESKYESMEYRRCGDSGLKLPAVSLGLWHNFGGQADYENMCKMCFTAFDGGITHFDLANNYGPPAGSAEENFGRILCDHLSRYRDELVISTKAGYYMWPGPYGDFGSKKYLTASIDQSLKRMGLEYVDIFYHHRMDKDTPLYETMWALDSIVKSGKALYVGLSNYDGETSCESYAKRYGITDAQEKEFFGTFMYQTYSHYAGKGKADSLSPIYKLACGYAQKDLNGDGADELVLLTEDYTPRGSLVSLAVLDMLSRMIVRILRIVGSTEMVLYMNTPKVPLNIKSNIKWRRVAHRLKRSLNIGWKSVWNMSPKLTSLPNIICLWVTRRSRSPKVNTKRWMTNTESISVNMRGRK